MSDTPRMDAALAADSRTIERGEQSDDMAPQVYVVGCQLERELTAKPAPEVAELVKRLRDCFQPVEDAFPQSDGSMLGLDAADALLALSAQLAEKERLAPLCEEHGTGLGSRGGCPYCAIRGFEMALSQIDYACGPPNDEQISAYDCDYDETRVVSAVKSKLAERDAEAARLRSELLQILKCPLPEHRRDDFVINTILTKVRMITYPADTKEGA